MIRSGFVGILVGIVVVVTAAAGGYFLVVQKHTLANPIVPDVAPELAAKKELDVFEDTALCTQEHDPVCGVDDKTYTNRCIAVHQNDVQVAYEGACERAIVQDLSTIPQTGQEIEASEDAIPDSYVDLDGQLSAFEGELFNAEVIGAYLSPEHAAYTERFSQSGA